MSNLDVDLSLPLATVLSKGTLSVHKDAENAPGAVLLANGELDQAEYVQWLMLMWHLYDALESALDRHASHPALAPTYNPSLLARAPSLASDISSFLQVPESSWETHPAHLAFLAHLPGALTNYLDRIHTLAEGDETPSLLLAHAYVRYLGDLSGGQIMKRRIAKAYALDPDDHDAAGVAFYEFRTLDGSGFARIGDMKKIKEWFRDGMNAAAGNDVRFKAIMLQEAREAFALNKDLLFTIRAPSAAPMGVQDNVEAEPEPERSFTLAAAMSVLAAVGLAHVIMVAGGLAGSRCLMLRVLGIRSLFASPNV